MKRIYLDHAATTPLDKRVAEAMRDFELEYFGNPSSVHREGQNARAKIDFARAAIAQFFAARPQEIIFTSGATEANNLAIQGVINYAIHKLKIKPHVITTKLEHQSVYNLVKELENRGVIEATFIEPSIDGQINAADVQKALNDNTVLVCSIFVSNEIGSVLPVREIGKFITEANAKRDHKILYHIDAVQASKFFNCNVEKLGCDFLTASAHKIYGPKGIGALFAKTGAKMDNLFYGGSQEYGKRPGTQNTTGIIGFAKAIELLGTLEQRQEDATNLSQLRDQLISGLESIPDVELNGPRGESRTADNVSIMVYDVDQDALITMLDLAGIAVSTGSACVSGSSEPSYVIESLGKTSHRPASTRGANKLNNESTRGGQAATIRYTLGRSTKAADITTAVKILKKILKQLRHEE